MKFFERHFERDIFSAIIIYIISISIMLIMIFSDNIILNWRFIIAFMVITIYFVFSIIYSLKPSDRYFINYILALFEDGGWWYLIDLERTPMIIAAKVIMAIVCFCDLYYLYKKAPNKHRERS